MANWDKLNQEFDGLLNNLSDEDWERWEQGRVAKREMRRMELVLRSKIQQEKILIAELGSSQTINQLVVSLEHPVIYKPFLINGFSPIVTKPPIENELPLAA